MPKMIVILCDECGAKIEELVPSKDFSTATKMSLSLYGDTTTNYICSIDCALGWLKRHAQGRRNTLSKTDMFGNGYIDEPEVKDGSIKIA